LTPSRPRSSAAKTAKTFSKTQLATSLVVVQHEEKVASNAGRGSGPSPPQKMFVFCNQQPQNLEEWEGWTFFNVSDRQT